MLTKESGLVGPIGVAESFHQRSPERPG